MSGESELRRFFYLLGCLALVGAILYWARPVVIPLSIAALATFVLAPTVGRMERWGVPRVIACTGTLIGFMMILIAIGHFFVQQMSLLTADIPAYKAQISEKIGTLRQATADTGIINAIDFANDLGKNPAADESSPEKQNEAIATKIEIPVLAVMQSVAGTAAEILLNGALVFVLALLMLMRREDLRNRIIQMLGTGNRVTATRALDDASRRVSRFLFSQLLINLGFGTVIAIGLYFIGIPFPYVWGALAALLRYIPFLGGWISAAFPLLASLIMPSWAPFFLTAAFFVIAEILQAFLVEPLVFGHSIGVSGPGQVIAMLFWATMWGPVGLILSTPLTACICVIGHHFPGLRFFATLIGDGEIVEKPDAFYQRLLADDAVEASKLAEEFLKDHSVTALVDEMLIPALLAVRNDHRNGELSIEDRISITEAVREVYRDVAAPAEKDSEAPQADDEKPRTHVLVVEFPFNDEVDDLVIEMLKSAVPSEKALWSTIAIGDHPLEQISQRLDFEPTLIVISTTARKNLARIRGACRTVHRLFPNAELLVCCWCLDSPTAANSPRLKDAGESVVCATFMQAQQLIETAANVERQPEMTSV